MEDKKLWFKNKKYGWGWTPCSWQGWAILAMYFFAVITNVIYLNNHGFSNSDFLMQFFPQTYILTVFLLIICWVKGEKPRWQWGDKNGNSDESPEKKSYFWKSIDLVRKFLVTVTTAIKNRD